MNRLLFLIACVASVLLLRAQENPPAAEPKLVQATASEELKGLAGQTVTVEGKVSRIGATQGGGITFLNMAPGMNAFVAIVFKSSAAPFPEGFDKYKSQTVRVTGKLMLFKETTPQIEIKTPDQIKVMPAAAEPPAGL